MKSYNTPLGELQVKVFGHASLLLQINEKKIYVDPYSEVADYTKYTNLIYRSSRLCSNFCKWNSNNKKLRWYGLV